MVRLLGKAIAVIGFARLEKKFDNIALNLGIKLITYPNHLSSEDECSFVFVLVHEPALLVGLEESFRKADFIKPALSSNGRNA